MELDTLGTVGYAVYVYTKHIWPFASGENSEIDFGANIEFGPTYAGEVGLVVDNG